MNGENVTPEVPSMVAGGGARWNPTKEQINMLENLYRQGLRTPTAEQIQEITGRLQMFGHIEGKNVFYWFQNHKARQRQKEKQDHISLFRQYNNRHLHPPFIHLPAPPNVLYEPCYIPTNNLGFYVHQPQVLSPTATAIKRRPPRSPKPISAEDAAYMFIHTPENTVPLAGESNTIDLEQNEHSHKETLDLFPMHPTGILKETVDTTTTGNGGCVASRGCTSSLTGGTVERVCFDFFC